MSQIESSPIGLKEDSLGSYESALLLATNEITIMKNDIRKICEQLDKITLYEIKGISEILDKISFYIPSGQYDISTYSEELLESIK